MIEQLLAENEGKTIEFKETTRSLNGIVRTIVAFANSAGGTIVIGVRIRPKTWWVFLKFCHKRSVWPMLLQTVFFLL